MARRIYPSGVGRLGVVPIYAVLHGCHVKLALVVDLFPARMIMLAGDKDALRSRSGMLHSCPRYHSKGDLIMQRGIIFDLNNNYKMVNIVFEWDENNLERNKRQMVRFIKKNPDKCYGKLLITIEEACSNECSTYRIYEREVTV